MSLQHLPQPIHARLPKVHEALKQRLLEFIDYFNHTFARPFRWTYTGRPVTASPVKRPSTWKERWVNSRESGETKAVVG